MPLRVVNKSRTYAITACETTFHVISLSVTEKAQLIQNLSELSAKADVDQQDLVFARFLDILSGAIVKIDGYEGQNVRDVLSNIEEMTQLLEIMRAVVAHCSLTFQEAKNSNSSSVPPVPDSARNAEIDAALDGVRASTTPTETGS